MTHSDRTPDPSTPEQPTTTEDENPWLRCIHVDCRTLYATAAEAAACELSHSPARQGK